MSAIARVMHAIASYPFIIHQMAPRDNPEAGPLLPIAADMLT
jgi:hypothetical protein